MKIYLLIISILVTNCLWANDNKKGKVMKSYPLIVVALEGPDGTGKSTLANAIAQKFHALYPPKSSSIELMPSTLEERVKWFKEEDSLVTARVYLKSHLARFRLLEEYNKRCHYKLISRNRFELPSILIWDRGPLSTRAYAYASIKTNDPELSDEIIKHFIDLHFEFEDQQEQIIYILMYPKNINLAEQLLKRAKGVTNSERELSLIENQISYYEKFWTKNGKTFLAIDPLDSQENNIKKVLAFIDEKLKDTHDKNRSFDKSKTSKRLFLSHIIKQIKLLPTKGSIIVAGGIVEKGYSDNDIDLLTSMESDRVILQEAFKQYPIHFLTKDEFNNTHKKFFIEVQ